MSLQKFLTEKLGYKGSAEVDALDGMAGKNIGRVSISSGLQEIRENIEPWMPLFFLPIGSETFEIGLHLRPSDVATQRLAFLRSEEGEFIEIASSPAHLVYLGLLSQEAHGYERGQMLTKFPAAVATANEIFGKDFYMTGRHGKFDTSGGERITIEKFGGSPAAFDFRGVFSSTPTEKLNWYERGIAVEPGCMRLYVGAVNAQIELNNRRGAAERFAQSLACYHHTAYDTDLDEYFDLGRSLLKEFPDLFSDDARWTVIETDPKNWVRKAGELFYAGEVERADKILNDVCYGISDYSGSLGAFRKHYEKLGWDWALALIDLREKP